MMHMFPRVCFVITLPNTKHKCASYLLSRKKKSTSMVVESTVPVLNDERVEEIVGIPVIDLSAKRVHVMKDMVKACEEFGFFKVINHGVSMDVVMKMEAMGQGFFSLPFSEKQKVGPPDPLGYGSRNIGFRGDSGEVEYLLLKTDFNSNPKLARSITIMESEEFGCVMREYIEAVKDLTCEILDMLGEGLGIGDTKVFSRLVRDEDSDSLVRFNHYPPDNSCFKDCNGRKQQQQCGTGRVGFGEHSDPQILTLLRSNDVEGLQILSTSHCRRNVWVPVKPDPDAFFVNVGDTLQALTNGRFTSVRHRAMANSSHRSRLSLIYFGGPSLQELIAPLPEMVTALRPRMYRSFTWGEYKKAMYSLRLGYDRLNLFRLEEEEDDEEEEYCSRDR